MKKKGNNPLGTTVVAVGFLIWSFFTPLGPVIFCLGGLILFGMGVKSLLDAAKPEIAVSGSPVAASVSPSVSASPSVNPRPGVSTSVPSTFNIPENIPDNLKCPSCGANIGATTRQCAYCGSNLQPYIDLPEPLHLAGLMVGGGVSVRHPSKGELTYQVTGRALIAELWQASQNAAWTPTGNLFAGFALLGNARAYLLSWQDRFFLLDKQHTINDQEIARHFLPHARLFGQGNQLTPVYFNYGGNNWKMIDIGRSRVEFVEGEGLHIQRGVEARFIHALSNDMALVVEDYRAGGGGQDMLWLGVSVSQSDIRI
jgi:hypothetical protein